MTTNNPSNIFDIQAEMHDRGYWMTLKSPFEPGEQWTCGFTLHGASGWNGKSDFSGVGETPDLAAQDAYSKFCGDGMTHSTKPNTKGSLDAIRELRKQWGTQVKSNPTNPQPTSRGVEDDRS